MERLKPVDVVIVGGGWTGLLIAKEIATRTALSVLVLERGPARKTSDYAADMDEVDYVLRFRMLQNIADETITHRHSPDVMAAPIRQHGGFHPGTGVGGAGEHWTGSTFRFVPEVFHLASHLREKHGKSRVLPEDSALQDWGITYKELEPYYWRAEQLLGVSGKAGNLRGQLKEGGNIFEGERSHEYPTPPHKTTYACSVFEKTALELGYHPFPEPAATISQNYTNPDGIMRPACLYCGYCQWFGCMIGAKAQPTNTLLPILHKRTNFELRAHAWVRRVVHQNGTAKGVQYVDRVADRELLQPASVVILASWTMNNPRLLMLSRIGEIYDSETGKGTVGKNVTYQGGSSTSVFFDRPLNGFMGAGGLGIAFADMDGDRVPPNSGLLRGGIVMLSTYGNRPIASFGTFPPGETKSNWGREWKKAALRWHDKVANIGFHCEHLPYRGHAVDLDPNYTDCFGDPLVRLTMDWTDYERRQWAFGTEVHHRIAKVMNVKPGMPRRMGSDRMGFSEYGGTHVQGGAILGDSPERSVVNTFLQHWQMPNLWVVGASCFPNNGAPNPTLTVLALTYRAADAFVERYQKHPETLL